MSFRHNLSAILLCTALSFIASCASSDHPVATPADSTTGAEPDYGQHGLKIGREPQIDVLEDLAVTDPELALNQLDEFLLTNDDPQLDLLFGIASLNLLEQRQQQGKLGLALAADLFADAEYSFTRCVKIPDLSARAQRGLARIGVRRGDFTRAWDFALQWHAASSESFSYNDYLLMGELGLRRIIADRQQAQAENHFDGINVPAPHLAVEAFEAALKIQPTYDTFIDLADLHIWEERYTAAAKVLIEAIKFAPDAETAYQRLKLSTVGNRNLHVDSLIQVCSYLSNSATALWYLGEAYYLQTQDARAAADFVKAMESLSKSEQCFEQSAILNQNFSQSCHDWISLVKTMRIWLLRDDGRIDDALASLTDILEYSPEALDYPIQSQSLANAVNYLVSDLYQQNEYRKAISLLRQVCAVNDSHALFVNNLGLFTRDLATMLSMDGASPSDEAQELYAESWDVYSRLVELTPDDPRAI
ncbi:MAG: hypothetical protein QGF46_07200, partial [Planctomycetota bacterium]|nr:hypothetical protein [Planctomycetota bacterium]